MISGTLRFSWVAAMLVAAFCALSMNFARGQSPTAANVKIRRTSTSFPSQGKTIKMDVFELVGAPSPHLRRLSSKDAPSVLVLHGAGGTLFDGPEMRRVAEELAGQGMRACVVHYFDGSGVGFTTRDRVLREHHDEWLAVVRDAVSFARSRSSDPQRPVGIYGYSMGAFLGVEASADNPGVGALAEQAGGVWDNETIRLGRMPPVLMIHGRDDQRVPFAKYAAPLKAALRQRGTVLEARFFDGEGHVFSSAAQKQVRPAVGKFFVGRLKLVIRGQDGGIPVRQTRRKTNQR